MRMQKILTTLFSTLFFEFIIFWCDLCMPESGTISPSNWRRLSAYSLHETLLTFKPNTQERPRLAPFQKRDQQEVL